MGFKQVSVYEKGQINNNPSNMFGPIKYLFVGFIMAVFIYIVSLIVYLIDDTLETKEEIEEALGISVIGEIPNFNETKKPSYGYGKYGYGYRKTTHAKNKIRKTGKRMR